MFVAIDFDGTIAEKDFPDIGKEVPGAFEWMKRWQAAGASLILWTCRHDLSPMGDVLGDAVEWCRDRGIEFAGVNQNSGGRMGLSCKVDAELYVDDRAVGCPLAEVDGGRPYVDWSVVGPLVLSILEKKYGVREDRQAG